MDIDNHHPLLYPQSTGLYLLASEVQHNIIYAGVWIGGKRGLVEVLWMEAVAFRQMLKQRDVTFFSGVPDSTFQAAIAPVEGIPRVSHAPIAIRDRFAAHIRND